MFYFRENDDNFKKCFFFPKNLFLALFPKLSTFRAKLRYFEITLKKLMFASFFGSISKSINISRKMTIFWDHFEKTDFSPKTSFLALFPELSIFQQKIKIFLPKNHFLAPPLNYQHFGDRGVIFRYLFEKIVFWLHLQNYQY